VELHNERLRKEREQTAMKIVRALAPGLTDAVRLLALNYCQLDGEKAAQVLKAFQAAKHEELRQLRKEVQHSCCLPHLLRTPANVAWDIHRDSLAQQGDNATSVADHWNQNSSVQHGSIWAHSIVCCL
jgi:hypothetical protein